MLNRAVYLDYAASTPLDPRVFELMQHLLQDPIAFANPSSLQHAFGRAAHEHVEAARQQLAQALSATATEIFWTSGATEANNLAIKGYAYANQHRGRHLITLKTEHKAVLDCFSELAKQGFRITLLPVDANGLLDLEDLQQALCPDTLLVSVMAVNNETGVIQDLARIQACVHAVGARLHVDAVQALGKMPLNLATLGADLVSVSAHKIYGPKGVGALYVRADPRLKLAALLQGGAQEKNLRAGTVATHQVCGFAAAATFAVAELEQHTTQVTELNQAFRALLARLPQVQIHAAVASRVPHILNVAFAGIDGQRLLARVNERVAVSNGSACNVHLHQPSHVLLAHGVPLTLAQASLRFSFSHLTTQPELDTAFAWLQEVLAAPL